MVFSSTLPQISLQSTLTRPPSRANIQSFVSILRSVCSVWFDLRVLGWAAKFYELSWYVVWGLMNWSWFRHFQHMKQQRWAKNTDELMSKCSMCACLCATVHQMCICLSKWHSGSSRANWIGQVSHVETASSSGKLRGEESLVSLEQWKTLRWKFLTNTGVCLYI